MEILFIGGVADGETYDLPGNVMTSRHSFKLSGDFASDALRHHDYKRQVFVVRRDGGSDEGAQFMVWSGLPKNAIDPLVEARAKVKVVA
ncbi:hypothetical protein [Burkholderia ubonensis]|uniref:hypothetical protein n=1 Tax=Burkholderia ubonensis TaxID=101571 RepID=UPI0012FA5948|nr:hypothetical protein [Burkholderia ubonensis]